jgi:hypothetical protein
MLQILILLGVKVTMQALATPGSDAAKPRRHPTSISGPAQVLAAGSG